MGIYSRDGKLYLLSYIGGRRSRRSLGLPDMPSGRKQARQIIGQIKVKAELRRHGIASQSDVASNQVTLNDLAKAIGHEKKQAKLAAESIIHFAWAANDFIDATGKSLVDDIERQDIVAWRDWMMLDKKPVLDENGIQKMDSKGRPVVKKALGWNTIRRRIGCLKQMIDLHAINHPEWNKPNLFAGITVTAVVKEASTLTDDETARFLGVLQHGDPVWLAIFLLQMMGGLRPAEINTLNWENIDLENDTIRVRTAKRKVNEDLRWRVVALHPVAKAQLLRIPEVKRQGRVLGERSMRWVRGKFEAKLKQAGIDRKNRGDGRLQIQQHSLRHWFATAFQSEGLDISLTARTIGHTSTDVTNRYLHPTIERQARVINSLPVIKPVNITLNKGGRKTKKQGSSSNNEPCLQNPQPQNSHSKGNEE